MECPRLTCILLPSPTWPSREAPLAAPRGSYVLSSHRALSLPFCVCDAIKCIRERKMSYLYTALLEEEGEIRAAKLKPY